MVASEPSRILPILQNDVPMVSDSIKATVEMLCLFLEFVCNFGLLLTLDWQMALMACFAYPLFAFVYYR